MTEQEKAKLISRALSRALEKIGGEYNVGADGVCAALLGNMVEQAKAAGVPELRLADWLRDVADVIERGEGGPFAAPTVN